MSTTTTLEFTRRPAAGGYTYEVAPTGDFEFSATVTRHPEGWAWSCQTFGRPAGRWHRPHPHRGAGSRAPVLRGHRVSAPTTPATTPTTKEHRMNATPPAHTCHGAIFCGHPRARAEAECPACQQAAPAPLTGADMRRASSDNRWLGFGYLGTRRHTEAAAELTAADEAVLDHANAEGWTYEELFTWANSKAGRHFGNVVFGGSGPLADRVAEAKRFGLLTRQPSA